MRNEGPFLLEWLSFHREIGFTDFLIFTNDCNDGSDELADCLAAKGLVTHVRNDDHQKKGPQWTALNSPPLRKALRGAEWAMHLDLDEFLNIKSGKGQLSDLIENVGQPDAISIPWRFFGNAGVLEFKDEPITRQFTRCGPYPIMFPRQAMMFKTLFRPSETLERGGVHAPRLAKGTTRENLSWLNGDGRQVSDAFDPKNPVMFGPDFGNSLAQINHYALRSMTSFLIKSHRGLPNHGRVPVDMSYWARRNFNDYQDVTLAEREFKNEFGDDPDLQVLHNRACDWHRAKAQSIIETPEGVEFLSALAVAGNTIVPDDSKVARLYQALGAVFGGEKN